MHGADPAAGGAGGLPGVTERTLYKVAKRSASRWCNLPFREPLRALMSFDLTTYYRKLIYTHIGSK